MFITIIISVLICTLSLCVCPRFTLAGYFWSLSLFCILFFPIPLPLPVSALLLITLSAALSQTTKIALDWIDHNRTYLVVVVVVVIVVETGATLIEAGECDISRIVRACGGWTKRK